MKIGDTIYINWVDNWGVMHVGDEANVTALQGLRRGDEFTVVIKRTSAEVSGWVDEDNAMLYKGTVVHPSMRDV